MGGGEEEQMFGNWKQSSLFLSIHLKLTDFITTLLLNGITHIKSLKNPHLRTTGVYYLFFVSHFFLPPAF